MKHRVRSEIPEAELRGIEFMNQSGTYICHSALDAESRGSRGNGNPFLLIVPCFRRDGVYIPAFAGMTMNEYNVYTQKQSFEEFF